MVVISYKHDTEDGCRKLSIVDRPVRQVVKLCDIEDSSLLDDITAVRKAATKIIDARKVVPQSEIDDVITQEKGIITIKDSEADKIDNESTPVETLNKTKVKTKKRKSELEKLKIENWQPPFDRKRNKTPNKSILSSTNNLT